MMFWKKNDPIGQVMHIWVSKLTIISSDGLSPGRRQAIIWANDYC